MRKTYEAPMMVCEPFKADEYVAVCYKADCVCIDNKTFVWIEKNGTPGLQAWVWGGVADERVDISGHDVGEHKVSFSWGNTQIEEAEKVNTYVGGSLFGIGIIGSEGKRVYQVKGTDGKLHYILPPEEGETYERDYANHS